MRLLFDHNMPAPLRRDLPGHDIELAVEWGWEELANGEVLSAAETAGFEILVTVDRKLRYQQNLAGRRTGLATRSTQNLAILRVPILRVH